MTAIRYLLTFITAASLLVIVAIYTFGPEALERAQNRVAGDKGAEPSESTQT